MNSLAVNAYFSFYLARFIGTSNGRWFDAFGGPRRMNVDTLAKIFDLYAPAIYNYAFRLCRDPLIADQIVGDVFAKLSEHLSTNGGPIINLRAYLYELAHHLVAHEARYSQRLELMQADLLHYVGYSADISAEKKALFEAAMRALMNELNDDQRHVVILRFMEGLSLKETAAIIGKKVNNVKVTQNRAVAALHKALGYSVGEINGALKSFNYLEILKAEYPPELVVARRAAPLASPRTSIGQDLQLAYH
jgi:RNA polymerase sigma-70 factor (ECF subfamily)